MRDERAGSQWESVLLKAAAGAVAGGIAVYLFDKLDWFAYEHEDAEARRRTQAVRPGGEAPAHVMAGRVARSLGLGSSATDQLGLGFHYALGVGPGAAYALLRDRAPLVGAGRGTLFGLALFLLQDEGLNTLMRTAAKPQEYPWQAHARGLVSHLLYGLVLDALVRAADRALRPGGATDLAEREVISDEDEDAAETTTWIGRPPGAEQSRYRTY